jgi:nicotinamide-nucleotide amidase
MFILKNMVMQNKETKAIIAECAGIIAAHNLTIAFVESATAGSLAFAFSQTEQSGEILKGGLVCYDACLKEDILGIPKNMIEEFTPESEEITRAMALKLKKIMKADIIVAVTGLTTEGGSEGPGKPVDTMFYCILYQNEITERKKIFSGSPDDIIENTLIQIAKTIIKILS